MAIESNDASGLSNEVLAHLGLILILVFAGSMGEAAIRAFDPGLAMTITIRAVEGLSSLGVVCTAARMFLQRFPLIGRVTRSAATWLRGRFKQTAKASKGDATTVIHYTSTSVTWSNGHLVTTAVRVTITIMVSPLCCMMLYRGV